MTYGTMHEKRWHQSLSRGYGWASLLLLAIAAGAYWWSAPMALTYGLWFAYGLAGIALVTYFVSLFHASRTRGYSGWWATLGVFGPIGVCMVLSFPDIWSEGPRYVAPKKSAPTSWSDQHSSLR